MSKVTPTQTMPSSAELVSAEESDATVRKYGAQIENRMRVRAVARAAPNER
jgi:hypothetical protein